MARETYLGFHPMLVLVLVVALGAIACVSLRRFFIRRQFARAHGCQSVARSFNKDPFLGLDVLYGVIRVFLEHKILESACEVFRVYGNTFTQNVLRRRAIMTVEPENIKTVLSLKFKEYGVGHRLEACKPLLGEGILDTDGDHWASSRALLRPSFTRDHVADLASFENLIQDLFSLLPRDGKTVVDLAGPFSRYTMDSATEFLFGESVGTLQETQPEVGLVEVFHYAQKAIKSRAALGPFNIFHRDRVADECNRVWREKVQHFVEEACHAVEAKEKHKEERQVETKRQKRIFSHELASRTSDKHRILDELMNVLLAAHGTTASLLTNLFFMLAKNPAIWDKLRREVAGLQGRTPTYKELRGLRYVQCCMNESLRLHPVLPRNGRKAVRDTVLPLGGGKDGLSPVFVAKGTRVAYNVYAMHRRTDFYGPDAEEFRPERWEDGKLQPGWGYLPFNGGRRICLGQRYALTEVSYVLVRMAQEFRVLESQDTGPWEELLNESLTLGSRNGVKVCLTPA